MSRSGLTRLVALTALLVTAWLVGPGRGEAQTPDSLSHAGGDFGLGLILGDPTGINAKYFLSSKIAIDGSLGFGFIGHDHIQINADALWHFGIQRWNAASLDLYAGVGPSLAFADHDHPDRGRDDDHVWLGARGPLGASFTFVRVPIDVFLELAPTLWIIDDVDVDLDIAVGVRFWF